MKFCRIQYETLNSRQQESYNFQKVSGVLADYGFTTIRLSDDWQGADFIAQHLDGNTFLKVQLKGRCTIAKKYVDKGIYVCFGESDSWYLVPHDDLLAWVSENMNALETESWKSGGLYSFPSMSGALREYLKQFRLTAAQQDAAGDA